MAEMAIRENIWSALMWKILPRRDSGDDVTCFELCRLARRDARIEVDDAERTSVFSRPPQTSARVHPSRFGVGITDKD